MRPVPKYASVYTIRVNYFKCVRRQLYTTDAMDERRSSEYILFNKNK